MSRPGPKKGTPKVPGSGGSRKGIPNKATGNAREAIALFVDQNSERLNDLLSQIESTEGPKAAWNCIMDLIEYHVPKLARTELTGKDGGPQEVKGNITITLVKPGDTNGKV